MKTQFNKFLYVGFLLLGLFQVFFTKDTMQAAASLGIALAFDPFNTEQKWNDRPTWQKMTLIDQLMSEINPNIQQGSFLKMLNENPEHKEYLEKICQLNFNVSGAKEIIQKLALENKISTRTNFYSNQIINCINDDNSNLNTSPVAITSLADTGQFIVRILSSGAARSPLTFGL